MKKIEFENSRERNQYFEDNFKIHESFTNDEKKLVFKICDKYFLLDEEDVFFESSDSSIIINYNDNRQCLEILKYSDKILIVTSNAISENLICDSFDDFLETLNNLLNVQL